MNADDVRNLLRTECRKAGEKSFADKAGVSRQFINAVLRGSKPPTKAILDALGLEISYRKKKTLDNMPPAERFSVYQFFSDETYIAVSKSLSAKEAVDTAHKITRSTAVGLGVVTRVIITDSGESTVFEWQVSKGVTYPPLDQA